MKDNVTLKTNVKRKRGVFPKVLAGVTAGAAVGLVTYMLTKTDKTEKKVVQDSQISEKKGERLFI